MAGSRSGRDRLEAEREAVHAVAQPRRLRAVIEHMAEVAAAAAAVDGRPGHADGGVGLGPDRLVERSPEARPARAAVELGVRGERVLLAPRAGKDALAVLF